MMRREEEDGIYNIHNRVEERTGLEKERRGEGEMERKGEERRGVERR